MRNTPKEGGIQHWPVDWTEQCDAKCRKTGERCPNTCDCQVPTTVATGDPALTDKWFSVYGKPVNLCSGHYQSWEARRKRLLTLSLINGGHLTPYNEHGYGSMVIKADRIDFALERPKVEIPPAWGWISWRGNVPEGMLERLPKFQPGKP